MEKESALPKDTIQPQIVAVNVDVDVDTAAPVQDGSATGPVEAD